MCGGVLLLDENIAVLVDAAGLVTVALWSLKTAAGEPAPTLTAASRLPGSHKITLKDVRGASAARAQAA